REAAPVIRLPSLVLITRFDEVKALFADAERLSNEFFLRGSQADKIKASFSPEGQRMWQEMADYDRDFISRAEGERHERLRTSAHRFFTPGRVNALTEVIQSIVNDLIDEAAEQ